MKQWLLFETLRGYQKNYLAKDIFTGLLIAAVSIPISMGYAEVAGLPAVYGLYGSVFPILFFAAFTSSPQFILGVDAAPAAIVGAALAALGIEAQSEAAMQYIPMMALFTGLWLLVFYFLKSGKIVNYISTPVMGGFISGIALTIILMQIPKILGSSSGTGELLELSEHILEAVKQIHLLSAALGAGALLLLMAAKKYAPRFPAAIVLMVLGVAAARMFHVEDYGVKLLASVEPGFPGFSLPDFRQVDITHAAGRSLTIAVVVMAETLLAENNFASKNHYKIQDNREILACAMGNLAAAFTGTCPVNGSISRTVMNEQYGGKTQAVSLTAGLSMLLLLLFGTGFIGSLPVPVLTAIVIAALTNVVELRLAKRLFRISRNEFYIFAAACGGVLLLGSVYGILIGILLSFVEVILKATDPARTFLGIVPGRDGFYDLKRNHSARPIDGVVIYKFSENLFFANIKIFQQDIENSVKENTKCVIVDAAAVTDIDITAADGLAAAADALEKKEIQFYFTEHPASMNEKLRRLGMGEMIEQGQIRRTITAALSAYGMEKRPYPLEEGEDQSQTGTLLAEQEDTLEEFAWAFGDEAVEKIEQKVRRIMESIRRLPDMERLAEAGIPEQADAWKHLGAIDEDEVLRRIELHVDELPQSLSGNRKLVLSLLERRRITIEETLKKENPEVLEKLRKSRKKLEKRLEQQNPEAARKLHQWEEDLKNIEQAEKIDAAGEF
ncbi:MAG TPA: STAS domain-containing protein [Candidatus Blautia merdavium]|uniref:STAS domain-containing protein n=1 Tax=Candidatus Blautia merdavium TaxID=2838494 RepID=A0A9D2PKP7_9FIRM|nr:STAS domain-containing protein [Candidatus Blautia merdavium]